MSIPVTVVYSPAAREVQEIFLVLGQGATLAQALQASGLEAMHPEVDFKKVEVGLWGRKVGAEHVLQANDRVEVYRTLRVNPKTARRERFASQGSRGAGLFAKKRADAKAGY